MMCPTCKHLGTINVELAAAGKPLVPHTAEDCEWPAGDSTTGQLASCFCQHKGVVREIKEIKLDSYGPDVGGFGKIVSVTEVEG